MWTTRAQLLPFVLPLLLLMSRSEDAGSKDRSDSLRATIDGLIGQLRTTATTSSDFDSILVLSDSIEHLAKASFGENDTSIAIASGFMGMAYIWKGNHSEAESRLLKAIRIWQTNHGPGCPQQASTMRILGDLYQFQHRDVESEDVLMRAIEILKNAPPYAGSWTSNWMLALLHNNLANLFRDQGRLDSAKSLYNEAERLWIGESGENSPDVAIVRSNLGAIALDQRDFAAAERYERLALNAFERSPRGTLNQPINAEGARLTLAFLSLRVGKIVEARAYFDKALIGYESYFGKASRGVLPVLQMGESIERASNNWIQATAFAEQAVLIVEQTDSQNTADLSSCLSNLADCLYKLGRHEQSLAAYDRASALRHEFMRGAFAYASEKSKLLYLGQFPLVDNAHLTFAVESRKSDVVTSVLQAVLIGKASALDALSEERKAAICAETPEMQLLIARYADVCSAIAELAVSSSWKSIATPSSSATSLYERKDSLELALSHQCSEFDDLPRMPAVSVAEVSKALPPHSVLWEYYRYRPSCFSRPDSALPPRYLAFTLDDQGRATIADLGDARVIDSLTELVCQGVQSGADVFLGEDESRLEEELNRVSSELAGMILSPLLKDAQAYEHILISPDGQLSLLPFEILPLSDDRYAIEEYEFSYLSTGRDLLRFQIPPGGEASGAVVMAAPDYESVQPGVYAQVAVDLDRLGANQFRGPSDRTECLAVPFNPLPGSAAEGRIVTDLLASRLGSSVNYLSGREASEESLKHLNRPPRILHIATHGYFCSKARYSDVSSLTESPLLYSGLAMAGGSRIIRQTDSASITQEDGILTALEASSLNLVGTDLVVLGACRTGTGTVIQGEGVYGLRRAFQLAGARAIVMSMFDLPDKTATDLVTRFYTSWLSGAAKSTALRTAELSVLKERRQSRGSAHPLFWGGLILTGDCR